MKRAPFNTNLHIHNKDTYQGFSIQTHCGPVIKNYLERAHECVFRSLNEYGRVCMIRFDLHVPNHYNPAVLTGNALIGRFFSSLKAKIEHAQARSRKQGHRVHNTDIRYVWCKEVSDTGRVHFHIALLLNHNAYGFVGYFNLNNNNMYSRIHQAWSSALNINIQNIQGLIHFPENNKYTITYNDEKSIEDAFYRISYLCKMDSKELNKGAHSFGFSRI